MTALTTYPGTVTPLRGLLSFSESDRDVFFGRDHERAELTRLVIGEGFRAGLLFGESGVGKTSLLRAGLVPHLRDQGVFVFTCDDLADPIRSFANAVMNETGAVAQSDETPVQYLARVVSEAMKGQLFLFVVDGLERVLDTSDEVLTQYAELYARVVSRSSGRARFLFSCAAEKVYALGRLERKTGSLFPPSNRFELARFELPVAVGVLERTVALAGLSCSPAMPQALAEALAHGGTVLPADLQLGALGIRDLGLASPASLEDIGGASELLRAWLLHAAEVTGDSRAALRVVGALAMGDGLTPHAPDPLAARANVDPGFVRHALASLQASVVVQAVAVPGYGEHHYCLTHSKLAAPAREISAPAREAARRAYELLGSKADSERARLTLREWFELRREGISPGTPAEAAVVQRTKRFYTTLFGAIAAVPVVLIILVYLMMSGHYYLDVGRPTGGGKQTVVAKRGRPGLSAFFWLPASPGFGDVIADSGLTRSTIGDEGWERAASEDLSGSNDAMAYVEATLRVAPKNLSALLRYASTGDTEALTELITAADTDEARVALLSSLAPIARGNPTEIAFLTQSLDAAEPSVQTAALGVIASGARRNPKAFGEVLARAMASTNAELRRLAITTARATGDASFAELAGTALGLASDAAARRELSAISASADSSGPSAAGAAAILRDRAASDASKSRARIDLERSFKTDPEGATDASVALATDNDAPPEERAFALGLVYELAPASRYESLKAPALEARQSKSEPVEAAALPLFARVNPTAAAGDLALLLDRKLSPELRQAVALAWGEVARKDARAAETALGSMLEDPDANVRAAAARAFGNVGRAAQGKLIEMVKKERYDVAIGAAYGLANSAEVGASSGTAVGGIYNLWKRKGKPRQKAAEVYAKLAKSKPAAVFGYLTASARARDDLDLHEIGARGLCNAFEADYKRAARELERSAGDEQLNVRRTVVECLVDTKKPIEAAELRIASELVDDSDVGIRADAVRVVARSLAAGKPSDTAIKALARAAQDKAREPRIIAIRALGQLGGTKLPEAAVAALPVAFRDAPESDKLDILGAAQKLGAGEVVSQASADESPAVRIAAIDTAIATQTQVAPTLNAALTDPDPAVRRAALERIAGGVAGMQRSDAEAALRLAIRDESEAIGDLALATLARVGGGDSATAELSRRLSARSERVRAQAARASIGLAETDGRAAIELLTPLLDDPSHDVRVALVPSLGKAMALTLSPAELGKSVRESESHATRRWVAVAALLTLAESDAGASAANAELSELATKGPPWARYAASLATALVESGADGIAFVQTLVP